MFEELFNKGGLSLDRLRNFLEMAEAGSIAKAAPQDLTRQSLISRQIKELEEFFGSELTVRRGKTLSLSPAGQRLASLVRGHLQGLADFQSEQAQQSKIFTLGSGSSTLEWLITSRLPRIAELLDGAILRTDLLRSRALVEGIADGTIDLAILRKDAIPEANRHNCLPICRLSFHLCVPRHLLKPGTTDAMLARPQTWQALPFAAGRDNSQTDKAIREAMTRAEVDFRPQFECSSMLQVQQLVREGHCAAVLPNLALGCLNPTDFVVLPFAPLATYGRQLVLHWNSRQMQRRGIEKNQLRAIAADFGSVG